MTAVRARASRRTKFFAVSAGGALVIGGLGYTLASWTDTEWVFGGNGADGTPAVGTSQFEVEQNVSLPYDPAEFQQAESSPGQGLQFSVGSLALSPGDHTYAPVALRTTATSLAGDLTLQPAVAASGITTNDADDLLWNALHLRVASIDDPDAACDESAFTTGENTIADGALSVVGGDASQHLLANGASTQQYCFDVSLPTSALPAGTNLDVLQRRAVAPAWQFTATSD